MSERVMFSDLVVGTRFFDPDCGEFFVKTDMDSARFDSGGDAFEDQVTGFDPYSYVETR
jgi:hypothetical protein